MANSSRDRAKVSTDKRGNIQHTREDGKKDQYKSRDTGKTETIEITPEDYKE